VVNEKNHAQCMQGEMSWTFHRFSKHVGEVVSDTREAYRLWSPDHHTGISKELNRSVRVVSSKGC